MGEAARMSPTRIVILTYGTRQPRDPFKAGRAISKRPHAKRPGWERIHPLMRWHGARLSPHPSPFPFVGQPGVPASEGARGGKKRGDGRAGPIAV